MALTKRLNLSRNRTIAFSHVIPFTRRVKENTRFVEKYVTGRRKILTILSIYTYIFLLRINNQIERAMSVRT